MTVPSGSSYGRKAKTGFERTKAKPTKEATMTTEKIGVDIIGAAAAIIHDERR